MLLLSRLDSGFVPASALVHLSDEGLFTPPLWKFGKGQLGARTSHSMRLAALPEQRETGPLMHQSSTTAFVHQRSGKALLGAFIATLAV
jgi:hypothetical protein